MARRFVKNNNYGNTPAGTPAPKPSEPQPEITALVEG